MKLKLEDGTEFDLDEYMQKNTQGLVNKNTELLDEIKKVKNKNKEFSDYLDSLKQEKEEIEKKTAKESGDFDKLLEMKDKEHSTKYSELENKYNAERAFNERQIIDGNLTDSLVKNGVAKEFMDAARAMLRSEFVIKTEGESRFAVKESDDGFVQLGDYVKSWAEKNPQFVSAPNNAGGGAIGNKGKSTGAKNPFSKDDFNLTEQGKLYRENPQLAAQLKAQAQ